MVARHPRCAMPWKEAVPGRGGDGSESGEIHRPTVADRHTFPSAEFPLHVGDVTATVGVPTLSQTVHVSDAELLDALVQVNLTVLPSYMGTLDTAYEWTKKVLSLGEQQRLKFACLLVEQPILAILEKCSSALNIATEERLSKRRRRMRIAFILVVHRLSPLRYHNHTLHLGGRQAWRVRHNGPQIVADRLISLQPGACV